MKNLTELQHMIATLPENEHYRMFEDSNVMIRAAAESGHETQVLNKLREVIQKEVIAKYEAATKEAYNLFR